MPATDRWRFATRAFCLSLLVSFLSAFSGQVGWAQVGAGDGPDVPFPTLGALPLPWEELQGVWEFSARGQTSQFSFEVRGRGARRSMRILEVEPTSQRVVASGVGIATENDRVIRATMRARAGGEDYALMLRYFVDPSVTGMGSLPATLLTLRPITAVAADQDFVVRKISPTPMISRQGRAVPRP